MKQEKLRSFIEELKYKLYDYIQVEGIRMASTGAFSCPNKRGHSHGDLTPSANYKSEGPDGYPSWKCHKCEIRGDTLDLAILIHDLEKDGYGFVYETLPYVCDKLGIEYDPKAFLEDGESVPGIVKFAGMTKRYIKDHPAPVSALTGELYGRMYNEAFAQKLLAAYPLGIGGKDLPTRDENPLLATVQENSLIIPLVEKGLVVGAIARHRKGIDPKYQNSIKDPANGIDYQPFINLNQGIKEAATTGVLYIFEGVFNTLACVAAGVPNCIGILGVGNARAIPAQVAGQGIWEVVLCLDKDIHGRNSALEAAVLLMNAGIKVSIYEPQVLTRDFDMDFNDNPDQARAHLLDARSRIDMIEFKIRYKLDYLGDSSQSDITKFERILSDITYFGSEVMVESYAKELEAYFGGKNVYAGEISDRIRQVLSDKNSPILNRINNMSTDRFKKLEKATTIEEKKMIINELAASVNNTIDQGSLPMGVVASRRLNTFLSPESQTPVIRYRTGFDNIDSPKVKTVEPLILTDSLLVGIAAKASHGKSTIVRSLALEWATNHKDAVVLYYSLDDAAKDTIYWMMSMLSGIKFNDLILHFNQFEDHIQKARETMMGFYGKSLYVFDKADGVGDLSSLLQCTRSVMREHKGKHAVLLIDNFYNLNDISRVGGDSKRGAVERSIDILKEEATARSSLVVNTLEVIKNNPGRISPIDIKESGAIDYRNNVTLTLYNSYKDKGAESKMVHVEGEQVNPILELHSHKVKRGAIHQDYLFILNGPTGTLTPLIDERDVDSGMSKLMADKTTYRAQQGAGGGYQDQGPSRARGGGYNTGNGGPLM